jgi:hypothetical protein
MVAVIDDLPVTAQAPESPLTLPEKPSRRLWPLIAGSVIVAVIVVTGTVAGLGVHDALIAGGIAAAVVAVLLMLWRLPQLRKHFARPGGGRSAARKSSFSRTRRMLGGAGKGRGKGILPKLGKGGGLGKLLPKGSGKGKGLLPKGKSGKGLLPKLGRAGKSLLPKGRGGKGILPKGKSGKGILPKLGARGKSLLPKGRSGRSPLGKGRASSALKRMMPHLAKGRRTGQNGKTARSRKSSGGGRSGAHPVKRLLSGTRRAIAAGKKVRGKPGQAVTGLAGLPFAGAKWLRSKLRRKSKKDPGGAPESNAAAGKDTEPAVAPDRQPGSPITATPGTSAPAARRSIMSASPHAAAEAIQQHIGSFEPENVEDLGRFLQGLPDIHDALAESLTRIADRFGDELPVHPAVTEHIREMAAQSAGLHDFADQTYSIFRSAHSDDLERLENPRRGEEFMDHSHQ